MLELLKHPQPFLVFCGPQPRFTFLAPSVAAILPDYPVAMAWESFGVIKGLSSSIGNPNSRNQPYLARISRASAKLLKYPNSFDRAILGRTAMTTKTNTAAGIPLKEVGRQGFGSTGDPQ